MSVLMKMTVFLDRDGTINQNLPFPNVNRPEKMELLPRAAEGIKMLNDLGCRVIVVTNQAGINNPKNDFTVAMYEKVTKRFTQLLWKAAEAKIDDIFWCPHTQDEDCGCRKPRIGLFTMAQEKYNDIDLTTSCIVGDRPDDMIAGQRLGMTTILVRTGHGEITEEGLGTSGKADYIVADLYEAAWKIKDIIDNRLPYSHNQETLL